MAKKQWNIELDGKKYVIEVDHGYWSGKTSILVNGEPVPTKKPPFLGIDFGSSHPFTLGKHKAVVLIKTNGLSFTFDLLLDDETENVGQTQFNPFAGSSLGLLLWETIDSESLAHLILKNAFTLTLGVLALSAVIWTLMGNPWEWLSLAILAPFVYLLSKKKQVWAGYVLVLLLVLGLLNSILSGRLPYMAVLLIWLNFRGVQAVRWLKRNKQ